MKKIIQSLIMMASMQIGLIGVAHAEKIQGNIKRAEAKVAMCIGCHAIPGYKTAFPFVYQVPYIGGQNQAYIEKALKAYQTGERRHPSMQAIAQSLTDQDIADLAAYYAAQNKKTASNSLR
jgi:cytochrome c553